MEATTLLLTFGGVAALSLLALLLLAWSEYAASAALRREQQTPLTDLLLELDLYDTRPITSLHAATTPPDGQETCVGR